MLFRSEAGAQGNLNFFKAFGDGPSGFTVHGSFVNNGHVSDIDVSLTGTEMSVGKGFGQGVGANLTVGWTFDDFYCSK